MYVLLGLLEVVLACIWASRRSRAAALRLIVPPAAAAVVLALSHFVVTDREEIVAAMHEMASDCQAKQTARVEFYLDADARVSLPLHIGGVNMTKGETVVVAGKTLTAFDVNVVDLRNVKVTVDGDKARAQGLTIVTGGRGGAAVDRMPLTWDVDWVRRDRGWKVILVRRPRYGVKLQ